MLVPQKISTWSYTDYQGSCHLEVSANGKEQSLNENVWGTSVLPWARFAVCMLKHYSSDIPIQEASGQLHWLLATEWHLLLTPHFTDQYKYSHFEKELIILSFNSPLSQIPSPCWRESYVCVVSAFLPTYLCSWNSRLSTEDPLLNSKAS